MVLDIAALGVSLLVVVLPGAAVLLLLGVRSPFWYASLAAPCSVVVAAMTGMATTALGASYGLPALATATVVIALGGGSRLVLRHRRRMIIGSRTRRRPRPVVSVLGLAVALLGIAVSLVSWLGGMGWTLRTYPQEHDMIFHLALSSYIARTGSGAPWNLAPTDVLTGSDPFFYPAGFHLLAGAVTQATGDVVVAVNAMTIVLVAIGAPLGAACLAAVLARSVGGARDVAAGAAGMASLLTATLYRPGAQLAHDGGILPNSVALALASGTLAGLFAWRRAPRSVLIAAGVAVAGGAIVHPSALITIGVSAVVYLAVDVARRGSRDLIPAVRAFLPPTSVAAVLALPTLVIGASAVAKTTSFATGTSDRPIALAVGKALSYAYSGYLDPDSIRSQFVAAMLILLGVLVLVAARRGIPALALVAVWFAIVISFLVAPGRGPAGVLTSFFYNSEPRVWSHLSLVGAPVGAVGLVLALRWLARHLPVVRRSAVPVVTAAFLAVLFGWYLAGSGYGYARTNENAIASRYATPDFTRVDGDDEAAAAWLAPRILPGQRVLNSANDGSTFLYTQYGLPVVNLATLGNPSSPASWGLMAEFRTYPSNPRVRRDLRDLDVVWVYVDSQAPSIGTGGAPDSWPRVNLLSVPRGLQNLDGLPGLVPAFRAGSVTIYRLEPDAIRAP
ncbi:DUF6541 family protein [Actinomycetospora termitidis]|uniref:Uncharacterized protein n=1 Tax=Actinomycetospora termitidis TaxID=3053470 RepID=A0ABT7M1Y7_9PSEU|nr:DUF6541 family protein [Actinomycetospora sp. Odt1-22]MDL5154670.1 hypothetical protein [Actinomycetospora sp. Odt1-22]